MANQGAKKRKEKNSRHLKNLLRFIIFPMFFYLVVRAGILYSTIKWKHWVGFLLTFFVYIIPYQQLAMMAKPTYSESGELEDGGFDLIVDGVFGSRLSSLKNFGTFIYWQDPFPELIPAFAAYKLLGFVKGFMSLGSEGPEKDEKSRKNREKMERKASRPKFARTRN